VLWHAGNEQEEALYLGALRKGLSDLGYIEGKNIELVNRFADEHYDRFDALAAGLVQAKVDVIVASIPPAAAAAKRHTNRIPIVFALAADPVGAHLVDSLAHPGSNVTGLSNVTLDLAAKHLEFLRDCFPKLSAIALLGNPNYDIFQQYLSATRDTAKKLGIGVRVVEAPSPDALARGFSDIASAPPDAVMLMPDAMFFNERTNIARLALAHKIPTITWNSDMTKAGILMSYGAILSDLFRRTATYVDKILKGAKPADLPVEQPVEFDFVVNLKTAKALALTIPPSVLARADEVIE
jgi:ABC-type uncharacterized transport system substrate-binding protein